MENNDWEINKSKNNELKAIINGNRYLAEEITVPIIMAVSEIYLTA